MAQKQNTDFLRFSAYSIKDLIVRKLTQDTNFSDQNFPASNLNILIDLVSYMYQVLLYNLNNAAAESMFADTQLYENMNRLCKFIGYNPMGARPGYCQFSFPLGDFNKNHWIPKYSAVPTELTAADGRPVFFSVGNIPISVNDRTAVDTTQTVTLYNGLWKLSPQTYLYQGNDWEEITLDGITSDASQNRFTGHQMVDIYAVKFADNNKDIEKCTLFTPAPMGLFKPSTTGDFLGSNKIELRKNIFTNDIPLPANNSTWDNYAHGVSKQNNCVFDLRLNEDKTYTARFGDGITGSKPEPNSVLYVMYFDAGADLPEDVTLGSVTDGVFRNDAGFFGMSEQLYGWTIGDNNNSVYDLTYSDDGTPKPMYVLQNVTIPTKRKAEETVDEIREHAPNWFKLAGRLVTQADYEYYISTSPDFPGISHCKCQNNWEYISTFYKWLYEVGLKKHNDGSFYLNQNNMSKMGWKVADAADGNNVYIWYKNNTGTVGESTSNSSNYRDRIMPLKDMTHEVVFQPAVQIDFAIAAFDPNTILNDFQSRIKQINEEGIQVVDASNEGGWFMDTETKIEVTMDTTNLYTSPVVQKNIAKIIHNYFTNSIVGQFINYGDILNEIYQIPGVRNVRTVKYKLVNGGIASINTFNGLSFMTCVHNLSIMNLEDSLEVGNAGFQLLPFQSAELLVDDYTVIEKQIQLISRSGTLLNAAQY